MVVTTRIRPSYGSTEATFFPKPGVDVSVRPPSSDPQLLQTTTPYFSVLASRNLLIDYQPNGSGKARPTIVTTASTGGASPSR